MQLDFTNKPTVRAAYELAHSHHLGIVRKYTNEPYIKHPVRVAETLLKYNCGSDQDVLAAALLHDCMEDENSHGIKMEAKQIARYCNGRVAGFVEALTCPAAGNRARRKEAYNNILAQAPWQVRAIKCADIIDNMSGLVEFDPKFAETYLDEKDAQLKVLRSSFDGAKPLWDAAKNAVAMERHAFALHLVKEGRQKEAERRADDALVEQLAMEELNREFHEFAMF
jgi:(p)ppGpp synthase/HD superfamily hydrolase